MNYAQRFLKICATITVGVNALVAGAICTTAAAEPAPPAGLLPRDVAPLAYRLDLKMDPSQPRFSGHERPARRRGIDVRWLSRLRSMSSWKVRPAVRRSTIA